MLPMKVERREAEGPVEWLESGQRLRQVTDAVLRLLGLAMTLLLLSAVASVALDLIAWQCGGNQRCLDTNGWLPFEKDGTTPYGLRLIVAAAPPTALVLLMWWFGRQVYLRPPVAGAAGEAPPDRRWANGVGGVADAWFWYSTPRVSIQRVLHTTAATALLTWLVSTSTAEAPLQRAIPAWAARTLHVTSWVALGVLATSVIFVAVALEPKVLKDDPSGRDVIKLHWSLKVFRHVAVLLFAATVGVAATATWQEAHGGEANLPAFDVTVELLYAAMAAFLFALTVLTVALRLRNRSYANAPRAYRPLWWGLGTPVVASVAALLAAGFTAGTVIQVARILGTPAPPTFECLTAACPAVPINVPSVQWVTAAGWGLLAALGLLGAILIAGSIWLGPTLRPKGDPFFDAIKKQYDETTVDTRTVAKIANMWRVASLKFRAQWVVLFLAVAGAVTIAFQAIPGTERLVNLLPGEPWRPPLLASAESVGRREDPWVVLLTDGGAWVVTAVIASLALVGFRAFRSQQWRRRVGVIWDLVSFWPRLTHPLVPPPYGGRAVLSLASRVREVSADAPSTKLVLAGHSQGSLIVMATALHLVDTSHDAGRRLGVLTYGSQLQWAYARLFPTFFGHATLKHLYRALDRRWYNLYRWTDWLGAPVLSYPTRGWLSGANPPTDERPWESLDGGRHTAFTGDAGARRLGNDVRLLDPMWIIPPADKPVARLLGHGGYYDDAAYFAVTKYLIDGSSQAAESGSQSMRRTPSPRSGS
jgi:hypothetical protein